MMNSNRTTPVSSFVPDHETEIVEVFDTELVTVRNERLNAKLKSEGVHEWAETSLLPQFVRVGSQVLDVGANVGYYTALLRLLVGRRGGVHAFEANPATCELLRRTVDRNQWANVTVAECAIGDSSGDLKIDYTPSLPAGRVAEDFNLGGWSLLAYGQGDLVIRQQTIDEYCRGQALPRVSFVKIDVEGYERLVLAGAQETLRRDKPVLMVEFLAEDEVGHDNVKEILQLLEAADYAVAKVAKRPQPHLRHLRPEDVQAAGYHFYGFCMPRSHVERCYPA